MAIQTFGDYARWHPHVHVLLADGLFRESGVFYVMPKVDLAPLAEMFRAKVLAMLKKEGRIDDALIAKLLTWRHNSGFSVHNGVRLARYDEAGREALAQHIPEKSFQLVRYYGWYSNRGRGVGQTARPMLPPSLHPRPRWKC
ncbi:transposase [Desulfurivibrio dismutans]|uniref:transposase n=1 Tax=Desulfurivibrio dismutans TaxID=1398908 RepID=UPI0023DBB66E|nr:transposase [Desulfurivibrio alkaliphilus]MDF1614049.1 transposase [Desulfurivibrio alkaliphilus]